MDDEVSQRITDLTISLDLLRMQQEIYLILCNIKMKGITDKCWPTKESTTFFKKKSFK